MYPGLFRIMVNLHIRSSECQIPEKKSALLMFGFVIEPAGGFKSRTSKEMDESHVSARRTRKGGDEATALTVAPQEAGRKLFH